MATKKAKQQEVIIIPSTTADANQVLFRLGELSRLADAVESEFADVVAELRAIADQRLAPVLEERKSAMISLELFADANRATLLVEGEKTVKLSAGNFGWRWTPFKVTLAKGGEQKALETIKSLRLKRYIRIKETLDKESLLKDRPIIQGIRYTQKEEFFVDPAPAVDDARASDNVVCLKAVA